MTRKQKRAQRARRHNMLTYGERNKPTQHLSEIRRRQRFGDNDIPFAIWKAQRP